MDRHWITGIILLLCCMCLPLCSSQEEEEEEEVPISALTQWAEAILDDVTYLEKRGTPGRIFAFGRRSFPVLLGAEDTDALVVVAELGQGRIVATAAEAYLKDVTIYDDGCVDEDADSKGLLYTGTRAVTKRGFTCQAWDQQEPHQHDFTESSFPDGAAGFNSNYCRNVDNGRAPWCFTTDPSRTRDPCEIPECIAADDTNDLNLVRFHNNVKQWVSRGAYQLPADLCYITDVADMACLDDARIKVAVCADTNGFATPATDARMLEWVRRGGGLFFGLQAWVWENYDGKDRLWTEIPFYAVLKEAGIGLTVKYAKDVSRQYITDLSSAGIARLHSLSMPYHVSQLTEIASMNSPSPYLELMIGIIGMEDHLAYTPDLRQAIARPLVPFLEDMESGMEWPYCNGVKVIYKTTALDFMFKMYISISFLGLWRTKKAYNVDQFPGDVANPPRRESTTITVNSTSKEFWTTGYYLLPGDEMTVTVTSSESNPTWSKFFVLVGLHDDKLYSHAYYYRYPITTRKVPLREVSMTISSIFGGTVVLLSPNDEPAYIEATISGLTKAPQYKLGDQASMEDWSQRRLAPAPWAELEGRHMTFYLPSGGIRDLDDPAPALEMWDRAVLSSWDLAAIPQKDRRHMSFIPDLQISVGTLHAGYPIMAHLYAYGYPSSEKWPMTAQNIPDVHWGLFHEIGHNIQRKEWTFDGYIECTVNIFSMLQMEKIAEISPFANNDWWVQRGNEEYVMDVVAGKDYSILSGGSRPWTALLSYGQLYLHFGWGCYNEVFKTYEDDRENNEDALPDIKKNGKKLDQWVARWSHVTQYNLCPLFEYWSYPLTICDTLSDYPAFLPTDDITTKQGGLARIDEIAETYPGLLRTLSSKPACYVPTYFDVESEMNAIRESTVNLKQKIAVMEKKQDLYYTSDNALVGRLMNLRLKFDSYNQKAPIKG